jgi:hypothetical protein
MAIVNLYDSLALDGYFDPTTPPGAKGKAGNMGGRVKCATATVEVGSADSATSTYHLARIPSNAIILGASRVYWDDLASSGAPTIDIGLFAVDSNITDDDDAINDGMDAATVNTSGLSVLKTPVDMIGLEAWDLVNGQTSNPGGELDLKLTLKDADVNAGGTVRLELLYVVP